MENHPTPTPPSPLQHQPQNPLADIGSDISEVESLLAIAQRPVVKQHLEQYLTVLRTRRESMRPAEPIHRDVVPPNSQIIYSDLKKFAWDQEGDFVEVYVDLENVGSVPQTQIQVSFAQNSVVATVHGLRGQNFRLTLQPLCHPIDPAASFHRIRTNRLYFKLKKAASTPWSSLFQKEDRFAGALKKENYDYSDPGKGLMDLMKNLYESGDDEMKKTIAKAWTESREKPPSFT